MSLRYCLIATLATFALAACGGGGGGTSNGGNPPGGGGGGGGTNPGDTTSPTVQSRTPTDGATGTEPSVVISALLNEAIEPASVTPNSLRVSRNGAPIAGAVALLTDGRTVQFTPDADLDRGSIVYQATLAGGITDVAGNALGSDVSWSFTTQPSRLYFIADDGVVGIELWVSDGTEAGTRLVRDINPGAADALPSELVVMNGALYFSADDGVSGRELWKSDGTEAGTVRVRDINPGARASRPMDLEVYNGELYFRATTDDFDTELWKSDGTEAGTVLVKDINPGTMAESFPYKLTVFNGELYFAAEHVDTGFELWKSDGTEAGTVLVKDIRPGPQSGARLELGFVFNGVLYFIADDDTTGDELWKTDGTTAGTVRVKDIFPGAIGSAPHAFTVFQNTLFFSARDTYVNGVTNTEMWTTDGTEAGTVRFKDINVGTGGSSPGPYTEYNGLLYFSANANPDTIGRELWRTDGTADGTVQFVDLDTFCCTPAGSSSPHSFKVYDGELFFVANDRITGDELWKTDGTVPGTVRIKDINPGSPSAVRSDLFELNGELYFSATGEFTGRELWKSDGTELGTVRVRDIAIGSISSHPDMFVVF